jgi:tetratricopeptide (TPR) repeat protein
VVTRPLPANRVVINRRKLIAAKNSYETTISGVSWIPLAGTEYGWIGRSFALHELKRVQEAFDFLLPAEDKFRKNWTISYNLACYCAQLDRLDEAQIWFKKAMAIDEHLVKRAAIDDPDLKPL